MVMIQKENGFIMFQSNFFQNTNLTGFLNLLSLKL